MDYLRSGGILVCGGLAGVMESAARGVTQVGGVATGILTDRDRRSASPYLSYARDGNRAGAHNLAVLCFADAADRALSEIGG